ncbi:hypothetical protein E2C01_031691 [Portunus trituberculatus]|uniref:Uncharacterized protein n=1 Tax=Portunus trituberculatus TaxID=210409 RepID=A0A5B7EYC6_PORTR|nr:hypothetical protein [Portunus trituberculatus]
MGNAAAYFHPTQHKEEGKQARHQRKTVLGIQDDGQVDSAGKIVISVREEDEAGRSCRGNRNSGVRTPSQDVRIVYHRVSSLGVMITFINALINCCVTYTVESFADELSSPTAKSISSSENNVFRMRCQSLIMLTLRMTCSA